MKKFLSVLLSVMLVIGILPTMALAEEPTMPAVTNLAYTNGVLSWGLPTNDNLTNSSGIYSWTKEGGSSIAVPYIQVDIYDTNGTLQKSVDVNHLESGTKNKLTLAFYLKAYFDKAGTYKVSAALKQQDGTLGEKAWLENVVIDGGKVLSLPEKGATAVGQGSNETEEVDRTEQLLPAKILRSNFYNKNVSGYVTITLAAPAKISSIMAHQCGYKVRGTYSYSLDGINWTPLVAGTDITVPGNGNNFKTTYSSSGYTFIPVVSGKEFVAQYIKYEHPSLSGNYALNQIYVNGQYLWTNLDTLAVSEGELSPAFSPDVTEYTVAIPDVESIPTVTAIKSFEGADVEITQATADNLTATVVVSCNDDVKTYTVTFTLPDAPPAEDTTDIKTSRGLDYIPYEANCGDAHSVLSTLLLDLRKDQKISGTKRNYTETPPYVRIDLGKTCDLTSVLTFANGSVHRSVVTLKYSNDKVEWTPINTTRQQFNKNAGENTFDSSATYANNFAFNESVKARYLEVTITGYYSDNSVALIGLNIYGIKPDDTELKELTLSNGTLAPEFSAGITNYNVVLAPDDDLPTVSATAKYGDADVSITQATESTMKATVTVTRGNAESTVYTINFNRIVEIPEDATVLKSLTLSSGTLTPAFSADVKAYTVEIAHDSALPTVSATAKYDNASAAVTQATESTMKATVTVTYEGAENTVYTVNFTRLPAPEVEVMTNLASLTVSEGTLAPAFAPDVTEYSVDIPNKNSIPTVSATAEKENAVVSIIQASAQNLEATVAVSYEGEETKTYRITFVDLSSSLKFDGDLLTWRAVEGATSYTITVYDADGNVNREVTSKTNQFDFNDKMAPAGTYSFSVTATNAEGTIIGEPSEAIFRSFDGYANQALKYNGGKAIKYISNTNSTTDATSIVGGTFATNDIPDGQFGYFQVELANICEIDKLMIATNQNGQSPYLSELEYSVDGIEWFPLTGLRWSKYQDPNVSTYRSHTTVLDQPILAKYIKLSKTQFTARQRVWQIEAYGKPSDKLDLTSITLSSGAYKEDFDPNLMVYNAEINAATDIPLVSATAKHDDVEVKITQATPETLKATVEVIYNGVNKKTYSIYFVVLTSDATLAGIYAGGEMIAGFDRETYSYRVLWNKSTEWPVFEAVATADGYATITYKQPSKADARASVTVTSADGLTTKTYNLEVLMNAALKKATSCSSGYNGSYSPNALDGSYTTKWYCSSNTGTQWMWVDLESMTDVYELYAYGVSTMKSTNYDIIEISTNGLDWERVTTTISASAATDIGTNHILLDYNFEPFRTRFIRISGSAVTKMQIWELEVYGIGDPIVSANTYLKNLELSHGTLSPAFNKHDTVYSVQVGATEELPTIAVCEAESAEATVSVVQPTLSTLCATITVTAENGISKRTYTINFEKEILPQKNASLADLSISHGELMPEFTNKVSDYMAIVSVDDPIPTVSATTAVSGANLSIVQPTESAPAIITVTSIDGTETQTYTVEVVKKSAKLSSLTVEGYTIAFDPDVYDYTVYLPADSTVIPAVTGVMADPSSSMYTSQATESKMKATIAVVTSGDEQEKTYTVTFIYEASLEDDYLRASNAVSGIKATNSSTEEEFMNAVNSAITNSNITVSWKERFSITKATDSKSGSVKGVIELSLYGKSVYITINKSIAALSSGGSGGGGGGGGGGGSSSGSSEGTTITPPAGNDTPVTPPAEMVSKEEIKASAKGHWAEKEICALVDAGIVQGDENGDLQLNKRVTRAELLTMLLRSVGAELVPYANTMADVRANDWYSSALQTAQNKGWVSGYQGFFRPGDTITREEAAKILCLAAGVNADDYNTENVTFTDVDKASDWAVPYIKLASAAGLMQGFDTGNFGPADALTRAQAMAICYRTIEGGAAK